MKVRIGGYGFRLRRDRTGFVCWKTHPHPRGRTICLGRCRLLVWWGR